MPRTFYDPAHPDCIVDRKAGVAVDRIVIHTMEGTFEGSRAWFKRGRDARPVPTAAHYLFSRAGDVCEMVPDEKKCYHANDYNSRSIGFEHEARIAAWDVRRDGAGNVKPPPFPVNDFPAAMLDASARCCATLLHKFGLPPDRVHVIGHNEVPGASHTDPGAAFPWDDYMARVRGYYAA